jgi:lipooligosaccharide transport system ATP-binding protein
VSAAALRVEGQRELALSSFEAAGRHRIAMPEPLLRITELTKRYGHQTVVDALSFEILPGECLGVIGPNGAGKTTTLRMCLGLTGPDAGTITAFGLDIPACVREAKARIGVVTQFDSLDPDFSCTENLRVYGRYFGLSRETIDARIPALLQFAALQARADAKPGELSGGMRRRLSLGRALVNDPDLLLLDEPTTGLDPQARHLMWERLQQLLQQVKAILLTTHFMDEAERLCDRLIVLDHGRKIAEGTPRDLIAEHLESDVVEVYGEGAGETARSHRGLAERVETSGETTFFYLSRPKPLLDALAFDSRVRYLHRPANLEDLFLKLTGRQIRDDA